MTKGSSDWDFIAKIIILGEAGIGKTSIWQRYCERSFSPDYICTIGVEAKVKTIKVDGKVGKFQIWDTAGQERFRIPTSTYLRVVSGVIIYYAINNRESFEKVGFWMGEVLKEADKRDHCVVLVGNKSDLSDQRVVSFDEGRELAESYGIHFFETSAKENLNINEMFLTLARGIRKLVLTPEKENQKLLLKSEKRTGYSKCF